MKPYLVAALTMAVALLAVVPVRAAMVSTGVPRLNGLWPEVNGVSPELTVVTPRVSGPVQDVLTGGSVTLLNSVGFMGKGQVFTDAINVPSAGTLTVKLAGISWLDALQNLNCFVSVPGGGIIGNANNGGLDTVQVQPGTFYVNWYGQASAPLYLGVYSISVNFQPTTPPPPAVPLPPSLALLVGGLTALALGLRRPRLSPATA